MFSMAHPHSTKNCVGVWKRSAYTDYYPYGDIFYETLFDNMFNGSKGCIQGSCVNNTGLLLPASYYCPGSSPYPIAITNNKYSCCCPSFGLRIEPKHWLGVWKHFGMEHFSCNLQMTSLFWDYYGRLLRKISMMTFLVGIHRM